MGERRLRIWWLVASGVAVLVAGLVAWLFIDANSSPSESDELARLAAAESLVGQLAVEAFDIGDPVWERDVVPDACSMFCGGCDEVALSNLVVSSEASRDEANAAFAAAVESAGGRLGDMDLVGVTWIAEADLDSPGGSFNAFIEWTDGETRLALATDCYRSGT